VQLFFVGQPLRRRRQLGNQPLAGVFLSM